MRALLFHAKDYGVSFHSFANRPNGIVCEEVEGKEEQTCEDCVVAFITVEKSDRKDKVVEGIVREIIKMCKEVNRSKAVVLPFAHLSNNLEDPEISLEILKKLRANLIRQILKS